MRSSDEIMARQKTRVRFRSADMDFIFSYLPAGNNNHVFFASAFSFLEAFYKEWFRFLLYTVLIQ